MEEVWSELEKRVVEDEHQAIIASQQQLRVEQEPEAEIPQQANVRTDEGMDMGPMLFCNHIWI